MGTVIQLKTKINNSYLDLKNSFDDKSVIKIKKIGKNVENDVGLII